MLAFAHAFLAIGAGFLTIVLLFAFATIALSVLAPEFVREEGGPKLTYLMLNMLYSALFAAAGGYVTASVSYRYPDYWATAGNPLVLSLTLALIVLLFSALSALQSRGSQPILYQLALTAVTPLAVFAGGLLRIKQLGLL